MRGLCTLTKEQPLIATAREKRVHSNEDPVQFSSVTQSCPTLCNPMNLSTPGLPVHHQLLELLKFMSIESVMPSNHLILCHPLLLPPLIFPSSIFQGVSSLHQVAKVLEFQLQHQSFQ